MCIDFTDLNKACQKDHFSLPAIGKLVDSMARHAMISFLDAISSNHQIQMDLENVEKNSLHH